MEPSTIRLLHKLRNIDAASFLMWLLATHSDDLEVFLERYLHPEKEARKVLKSTGNKIEAIKVYRRYTGMGIKETKDIIDSIDEDLKRSSQFFDF